MGMMLKGMYGEGESRGKPANPVLPGNPLNWLCVV